MDSWAMELLKLDGLSMIWKSRSKEVYKHKDFRPWLFCEADILHIRGNIMTISFFSLKSKLSFPLIKNEKYHI